MHEDYLIVHKSILPECFIAVLEAKSLVDDDEMSVSDACRKTGISRSTFYKYKDKVYTPSSTYGRKAIIAIKTADKMGVLSAILNKIAHYGANVININHAIPVGSSAYVTFALDVSSMSADINELVANLRNVDFVKSVNVIAVE